MPHVHSVFPSLYWTCKAHTGTNAQFPIQPAEPPIVELEADQVPPLDAHGQPSMQSKIKNTIVTVYCNMAACHAKNANCKSSPVGARIAV